MTTSTDHPGVTMYTPALDRNNKPREIIAGKYPRLTSLALCTEDAIKSSDLQEAVTFLKQITEELAYQQVSVQVYIRVRNPMIMREVLNMNTTGLTGLILPKFHAGNALDYLDLLSDQHAHLRLMPTLETAEATQEQQMQRLADLLSIHPKQHQINRLRIGGNDLLNILGCRRARGKTIYEGPLERIISMLISVFRIRGYLLSSPVYEVFEDVLTLKREVQADTEYGLSGKTVIHPNQIGVVLEGFKVSNDDLDEAKAILDPASPAVFKMNGRMCEPTTHTKWANDIIERATLFGLKCEQTSTQAGLSHAAN